jgi:pimeloyl-ACP methyl ester carboxylesterase
VILIHSGASDRHNPGHLYVAGVLNLGHLATILIDLHPAGESPIDLHAEDLHFDIGPLAQRLVAITDWTRGHDKLRTLGVGTLGSGTGAAVSLAAAAERPRLVKAVVSLGGRPDLAGPAIQWVGANCLFIVGAGDPVELDLNRAMMAELPASTVRRLDCIPGATHFFVELDALELAANRARNWFQMYLKGKPTGRSHPAKSTILIPVNPVPVCAEPLTAG